MDSDKYIELRDKIRRLRKEFDPSDSKNVPPGILLLRRLLDDANNDADYIALSGLLLGEYAVYNMRKEEELLIKEEINRFPDKPIPRITLANFLANVSNDLDAASHAVEIAVEKALKEGNFVRDAYNCRANIALQMKNYKLLEETLKKLIYFTGVPGSINVQLESDFLAKIPDGVVDTSILNTYKKLVRESR